METAAKFLGYLAIIVILPLAAAVPAGFTLMLLMGALHGSVSAAVPALDFATAYLIAVLMSWTIVFMRPVQRSST